MHTIERNGEPELKQKLALKQRLLLYVVVDKTDNFKDFAEDDEIKINYLKKSFAKWIVALHGLDSRIISDFKCVNATIELLDKGKFDSGISRNPEPVELVNMNIYQSNI